MYWKGPIQTYIFRICDGGTVEYLRDLVCHKEALQVELIETNKYDVPTQKQGLCSNWEQKGLFHPFVNQLMQWKKLSQVDTNQQNELVSRLIEQGLKSDF